ncbi:MAG: hypothetical protein AAGA18_05215 [Verrucomicrobiota bacterium]
MDDLSPEEAKALEKKFLLSVRHFRTQFGYHLFSKFSGAIQSGPFSGMKLLLDSSWSDGDLCPKIIGTFEQELHEEIYRVIDKKYKLIVNIGCAEGYYSVGFAKNMPDTTRVIAIDIDKKALSICSKVAKANGVDSKISFKTGCSPESLKDILLKSDDVLLFLDCEGAERELLDPGVIPELRRVDFVVECHDFLGDKITSQLQARFKATHEITIITEQTRDPYAYDILKGLNGLDKQIVLCEFRPETMQWLVCRSQSSHR